MIMKKRMRISKGGQISIPSRVRRRWGTETIVLLDEGDRLVVKPAPDDPIAAAEGALAEFGPIDTVEMRRQAREDEEAAEDEKWRRYSTLTPS
ncbi:MAG: AbrB/MazE/SpoVT family DNA-binding domain-containing protein [Candidatus Dormibacteraeota bacterium]|nr:AbrB/MazE/SpoVT family DNA-binding domain-containing protein [Candidatus Dormibacteraeota bacterium]